MRILCLLMLLLTAQHGWSWGNDGHRIVARIAAMHLSDGARKRVTALLNKDPELSVLLGDQAPQSQLADAMAFAAVWPDNMPGGKGPTAPWHYIDIGLFEGPAHMKTRCPGGACIVGKINQYRKNLKHNKNDKNWRPLDQLKFLIHFVGDIHQPLHCATNADAGGNCVLEKKITTEKFTSNLHSFWDIDLVTQISLESGNPKNDGEMALEIAEKFQSKASEWRQFGKIADIARESFAIARDHIYAPAQVPIITKFINVIPPKDCETKAPPTIRDLRVDFKETFGESARLIVKEQLFKAGVRLAAILNQIYEK